MSNVISVRDVEIPLKIKKHWKNGIRYSISKKQINLTIPVFYSEKMQNSEIEKLTSWVEKKVDGDRKILERFRTREYQSGDILIVQGLHFYLEFNPHKSKTISGEIDGKIIKINIPDDQNLHKNGAMITRLLSRLFSARFLPTIEERVNHLNNIHFCENLGRVRLKYNISNWGSCSIKRNINLSSRLLMAPQDILDYVIIHELAHLREMNHSPKFWSIIENVMPNYGQKEQWLKENGPSLKF